MEDLSFYVNRGKKWCNSEDYELVDLYNDEHLDINSIAIKLLRTPGSILARLKKHKLIDDTRKARGYDIYLKSNLYKSVNKKSGVLNNGKKLNKIIQLLEDLTEKLDKFPDIDKTSG